MRFDSPLDDLFRNASHVRVLRALVELPERLGVSAREVARRARISHPTAATVLRSLAEQGLVAIVTSLRGDEYQLNPEHLWFGEIKEMFGRERRLREELVSFLGDAIAREAPPVSSAYLFGSLVWGEMLPDSDVDVAVFCHRLDRTGVDVGMSRVADEVRTRFGNHLNVLVKTLVDDAELQQGVPGRRTRLAQRIFKEGVPIPLTRPGLSARHA